MYDTIKQAPLAIALTLAGTFLTPNAAGAASMDERLDQLDLPPGFDIEVYAEVPGARSLAFGQSTGTVFVGTRGKKLFGVVDKNKDRKADRVVTLMDDLKVGNGVAMHQGNLYVAEQHRITRVGGAGFDIDMPFAQMREEIFTDLPDKAHHGWRYIAFGPDGKLYVTVGAPCNICDPEGIEATVIRMDPDGSDMEVYARGVRNSVGIDFQPDTGTPYFTDNGVDMMGDERPAGELNAAPEAGMHFGFPYYAGGDDRQSDWEDKEPPQEVTFPVTEFRAHTANLGFRFYTGDMFPAEYQHDAIVAQHGSWNRSEPIGYRLMRVTFDEDGNATGKKVFVDGWLQDGEAWGRPVDTLQMPDGSLLVSDDYADVIYRISYKGDDADTNAGESETTADFAMPESVVAHADGRQFITEIGEFGKDGDGRVTVIDPDGNRRTLAEGMDDPKGIDLWRDSLYVADNTRLRRVGLDGDTSVVADTGDFPGTATFLNDVEVDGKGRVYVSDSGSEAGDNAGIYRVSPEGEVELVFDATESDAMSRPNGLLMDGPNHLLVADFGNGRLFRLQLDTGELTTLNNGFGGADGLVRDSHGNLYVSDWNNGRVFMLHDLRATPMLLRDGFKAAADIALSADGRKLLVPDMKAGSLLTLPLD
ncbi:SMP-30/gluconolactonase/LRE family protein [Salinisphaera sp. P385]|uniref:SMP-30/gluconolactonase/LRE family protein n=1 Tax=Spectribacter acetivorans TaxID=3075603 RepID=A0ABU3B4G6_9GAMM|nr:SMP-30/gluconolactonase/LRE family protein [Salinisphaera sp. P385]MDT0617010.1 SMP-30/gluconolactonase/LRE family protein [Salinisphaera sp. P385]